MKHLFVLFIALSTSPLVFGSAPDKTDVLNGVELLSSKESSTRSYVGHIEKSLPYGFHTVMKGITNFADKCNNEFKKKRVFTSEEDCKYLNENLIETIVIKDIKRPENLKSFKDSYLIGRRVYNRGEFGYYELVTVRESLNEKNQKVTHIDLTMLNDDEVKNYTDLKIKKDSAFDSSISSYKVTEVSPTETLVRYEYSATTKHWLLNKEITVPQVFSSISKGINLLFESIEGESSFLKREVASQN